MGVFFALPSNQQQVLTVSGGPSQGTNGPHYFAGLSTAMTCLLHEMQVAWLLSGTSLTLKTLWFPVRFAVDLIENKLATGLLWSCFQGCSKPQTDQSRVKSWLSFVCCPADPSNPGFPSKLTRTRVMELEQRSRSKQMVGVFGIFVGPRLSEAFRAVPQLPLAKP